MIGEEVVDGTEGVPTEFRGGRLIWSRPKRNRSRIALLDWVRLPGYAGLRRSRLGTVIVAVELRVRPSRSGSET
jgi:hypothetical protein